MKSKKKNIDFTSYASVVLENIRDDCRRNEQPDTYEASYKPLLLESSQNFRKQHIRPMSVNFNGHPRSKIGSNSAMNFSTANQATYKVATLSRPKSVRSYRYGSERPQSSKNTFLTSCEKTTTLFKQTISVVSKDDITSFLTRLYFAKTRDLKISTNPRQEKIFISRLQRTVTDTQFVAAQCDLGKYSICTIIKYLQNRQITKLVLDKNPLGDDSAIRIAEIIPTLALKQLSLVSINMSYKGGSRILQSLIGHPSLQVLDLSSPEGLNRNRINPEGFVHIKQVFEHPLCCLSSLNLANTGMGETGFLYFCSGLGSQSQIRFKYLNLAHNQISISQTNEPLVRTCLGRIGIVHLEMQGNNLADIGIKTLANLIGTHYGRNNISVSLESLDISSNNCKSFGFEALCTSLPSNKKLMALYVNSNNLVEHEVFYYIKHLLMYNWSLKKIHMRHTIPSSSFDHVSYHVKALAQGLHQNKSVRQLDLSFNLMDTSATTSLFEALEANTTLKVLKLEGCGIDDNHILMIQKSLKASKGLSSLNFSTNFITDKGAHFLAKILSQVHSLVDLNVKKNCLSLHVLNELAYQLNQNNVTNENKEDPEEAYISYVSELQAEQQKKILKTIAQLTEKTKLVNARDLAIDVVGKQEEITKMAQDIKNESDKIARLEQAVSEETKTKRASRRTSKQQMNERINELMNQ